MGEFADRRFSYGASKEKRAGGDGGLSLMLLLMRMMLIKG